jgi:ABC-type glycerol-3-phosphate transport system permease component
MPTYRATTRHPKSLASTVLALVILAVMLFPVYWMVNSSLQPGATSFTTSWLPVHLGLSGYRQALSTQGGHRGWLGRSGSAGPTRRPTATSSSAWGGEASAACR